MTKPYLHYKQICLPGLIINCNKQARLTLKAVQPNSFSKPISQSVSLFFNFCPSVTFFCIFLLLKCSFTILICYCIFHSVRWPFSRVRIWLNSVTHSLRVIPYPATVPPSRPSQNMYLDPASLESQFSA